ncbi:thiolase family protein [Arthrobacter sp. ISL-85]|uniref:thiolase family protein n=1 Tax=Arthrobacter sp. ISL-85 TaxID=2819115 RepID=UPI001BEB94B9|nr:thiolase family protein [Arthrobacter sp. ISL-85]MBT2565175.1 thiolase family protein [Arthrobacter sp. ISL-85]
MVLITDLRPVHVVGIGLHPYQYPTETSYIELGLQAVREAIVDAGITWPTVEAAFVGTARLGMAAGVPMLRYLGMTGLRVSQVENASATGSTAFRQAVAEVASGLADVAIAIGVDKPIGRIAAPDTGITPISPVQDVPFARYALLTERYLAEAGYTKEQIGLVAVKNHNNGALNPYAQRRKKRTLEEVVRPPYVAGSLNSLQITPIGEGAAAVIVMSEEAMERYKVDQSRSVRVAASSTVSDQAFDGANADVALTQAATQAAYEEWGGDPSDLDVVEVHDAFAIEELLFVEAMGLCPPGQGAAELAKGSFDIGGRHAVSPSGGLLSMGHPLGPTGLGQIAEITRQLRGEAGVRQQPDAKVGLAHMVGIGPVCVVHILQR